MDIGKGGRARASVWIIHNPAYTYMREKIIVLLCFVLFLVVVGLAGNMQYDTCVQYGVGC